MRLGFLALQLQATWGDAMCCALLEDAVILIIFETNIQTTCIFKGKPLIHCENLLRGLKHGGLNMKLKITHKLYFICF